MPARILIIKPSSLGDVATALPLLCDLKRAYPQAQIDWMIHPALAALVEGHDALHNLIPFDRKNLGGWFYRPAATAALWKLARTLRHNKYDCVIDAQGLLRSGLFAFLTAAPVRIGFATAREGARMFYTHKVRLPNNGGGKGGVGVVRMRALLEPLGLETKEPAEFRVPLQAEAITTAARWLANDVSRPPTVIIPGARWDTKRWPAERFVEIILRMREAGHRAVLIGSPGERELGGIIAGQCAGKLQDQSPVLNLAGRTSMAEMIAVLAQAGLVVGNDSGPLHVAVALSRPVVGIYGPTDPEFVGPYGQLDHVVRAAVPCQFCRRHTCSDHQCMDKITVDAVWNKITEITKI